MIRETVKYPTHDRTHFYKYVSAETAKVVLATQQVRYSSPLAFNDPFDVQTGLHHSFDLDQLPRRLLQRIEELVLADDEPPFLGEGPGWSRVILKAREYRPTHGFPRERWEAFVGPHLQALAQEFKDEHQRFQHFWLERLPRMRVFCVAEEKDNLLMWSHYAQHHKGAVVEFRVMPEIDNSLCAASPVIYDTRVPTPFSEDHFVDSIVGLAQLQLQDLVVHYARVKSDVWSYEKEWRLYDLLDQPEELLYTDYSLPPGVVSAVYLGCCMKPEDKVEIAQLLRKSFPDAALLEAQKRRGHYALEFTKGDL